MPSLGLTIRDGRLPWDCDVCARGQTKDNDRRKKLDYPKFVLAAKRPRGTPSHIDRISRERLPRNEPAKWLGKRTRLTTELRRKNADARESGTNNWQVSTMTAATRWQNSALKSSGRSGNCGGSSTRCACGGLSSRASNFNLRMQRHAQAERVCRDAHAYAHAKANANIQSHMHAGARDDRSTHERAANTLDD